MKVLAAICLCALALCACTSSSAEDNAAKPSKDARIETGVQLVHAIAAWHERYKAGLNDASLIAFFNNPDNAETFEAYWEKIAGDWFSARVTPCRHFSHWGQFREERFWVAAAHAFLVSDLKESLSERETAELFGVGWKELRELGEDDILPAPTSPRVLSMDALERHKLQFRELFKRYRLDAAGDTAACLREQVFGELDDGLIHHSSGLRAKVLTEYKKQLVAELDKLRQHSGLIECIRIEVPDQMLAGFTGAHLSVISPTPVEGSVKLRTSTETRLVGQVEVGTGSAVGETPAYSFKLRSGESESVGVWLRAP